VDNFGDNLSRQKWKFINRRNDGIKPCLKVIHKHRRTLWIEFKKVILMPGDS
jgi:hypothetical protein